jgi:hypothetical protein
VGEEYRSLKLMFKVDFFLPKMFIECMG